MSVGHVRITATLAAVVIGAALAGRRVFPDDDFLLDVVFLAGTGLLIPGLLAWRRVAVWWWLPLSLVATTLLLTGRHLPDTTWWGVPTGHTWTEVGEIWQFARENLPSARPPVPYDSEWGLLFGVAFAVTVVITAIVAFAVGAPRWALVPSGATFCMFIVFGRGGGADASTAGFLAVVLVALAVMAPGTGRLARPSTLPGNRLHRTTAVAGMVALTTAVGVLVGPVAPGTGSDAWVPVRGRSPGALLLDHPIVDIRGRLVDRSTDEMFRVIGEQASYWRLASLAQFDGVTFTVARRQLFRLDVDTTASAAPSLRHEVVITQLPGRLVPAAPEPTRLDRRDVRFNPDTAALVTSRLLDEGDRYLIESTPPDLTAARLMGPATASAGPVPDPVYTSLPPALPATVSATARAVVQGWGVDPETAVMQPYVTALALQDWFRREFEYRLDVDFGREASAIASFLEQREGYCEQFAIAFAVMARTLGIPSRVAVGFTPGERLDDGSWSVQGRHAHAWPEVWFAEVGWVGFEPTPGRGAPGAQAYTGLAAAQDGDGDGSGDGDGDGPGDGDEFEPGADPSDATPDDGDPFADLDVVPDVPLGDITLDEQSDTASPVLVLRTLGLLLVVVLGGGPWLVRWLRDQRRRRRSTSELIDHLWPRVCTWLQAAQVPVAPSMTAREVMTVTARRHPDVSRTLGPVVDDLERVAYSAAGAPTVTPGAVLRHVADVRRLLRRKRRFIDRIADYVRPWRD